VVCCSSIVATITIPLEQLLQSTLSLTKLGSLLQRSKVDHSKLLFDDGGQYCRHDHCQK
jgi:hypothetical protein